MLRICFPVPGAKLKEKFQKSSNPGKLSLFSELFEQVLKTNYSYFFTTKAEECLERLKNNQSDFSAGLVSYYKNLDGFNVPVPIKLQRVQLVSGYKLNLSEIKPQESATVMENVDLIGLSVHLTALGTIFSAIFIVLASILIHLKHHKERRNKKYSHHQLIKRALKKLIKELVLICYGSTTRFKWISFLFTVVIFYMIKSFTCLYKTSQIIIHEPFIVKNYEMLLKDEKSLPMFYDSTNIIPNTFKFAPEGSTRNKIWLKLISSKLNLKDYILPRETNYADHKFLKKLFTKMNEENSVFLGYWFAEYIFMALCTISPEEELWRVFKFMDETDKEELRGNAVSIHYSHPKSMTKHLLIILESNIMIGTYANLIEKYRSRISKNLNTTHKHQYEQRVVCSKDYKPHPDLEVHAIGFNYFSSFFSACLIIYIIAYYVLLYEKLSYILSRKRRNLSTRKLIVKLLRNKQQCFYFCLSIIFSLISLFKFLTMVF